MRLRCNHHNDRAFLPCPGYLDYMRPAPFYDRREWRVHHVTARGNHRNDIFFKHADRTLLDEIMAEAVSRRGLDTHRFRLRWNRFIWHLQGDLLELDGTPENTLKALGVLRVHSWT